MNADYPVTSRARHNAVGLQRAASANKQVNESENLIDQDGANPDVSFAFIVHLYVGLISRKARNRENGALFDRSRALGGELVAGTQNLSEAC